MAASLELLVAVDLRSFVRLHYLLCFLSCLRNCDVCGMSKNACLTPPPCCVAVFSPQQALMDWEHFPCSSKGQLLLGLLLPPLDVLHASLQPWVKMFWPLLLTCGLPEGFKDWVPWYWFWDSFPHTCILYCWAAMAELLWLSTFHSYHEESWIVCANVVNGFGTACSTFWMWAIMLCPPWCSRFFKEHVWNVFLLKISSSGCLLLMWCAHILQADAETFKVVSAVIAEQLAINVNDVRAESKFTDLGADSLDTVSVLWKTSRDLRSWLKIFLARILH
jgi:hypothetical protein